MLNESTPSAESCFGKETLKKDIRQESHGRLLLDRRRKEARELRTWLFGIMVAA